MSVVEPVFANIGTNKGLNRFTLRGKQKVQGQWRLYCMVYNIEKLMRYGAMT
jgi:Transposase DDE domain